MSSELLFSKVTIRILSQMANVLEGRSSYHQHRRKMLSLKEITLEEVGRRRFQDEIGRPRCGT